MTHQERREQIQRIAENVWKDFENLVRYKNELEEVGCMAESKKLDTVCGKLYSLYYKLNDKCKAK